MAVLEILAVHVQAEPGRRHIERVGGQVEAGLGLLGAGLEIKVADPLGLLELLQQRHRAPDRRRAFTPYPGGSRGVYELGEVIAEEGIEHTTEPEHMPEIRQRHIVGAGAVERVATLDQLAALLEDRLVVAT